MMKKMEFKAGDVISGGGFKALGTMTEWIVLFVGKEQYFLSKLPNEDYVEECLSIEYVDRNFSLKPKKITISDDDFDAAWDRAVRSAGLVPNPNSLILEKLKKELGF